MLRPSLIIWRMAGTPAAVAGIFTITLGRAIVSCRCRAAITVASVSLAMSGATSTLTNPSPPPDDSYSGAKTSRAPLMSCSTIAQ
jgi:hypothetical protein